MIEYKRIGPPLRAAWQSDPVRPGSSYVWFNEVSDGTGWIALPSGLKMTVDFVAG